MAFPPNASKLAAYRSTSAHSGVAAADAHGLIVMLMDGALERIATARGLMTHGGGADKAQLLHRAVNSHACARNRRADSTDFSQRERSAQLARLEKLTKRCRPVWLNLRKCRRRSASPGTT